MKLKEEKKQANFNLTTKARQLLCKLSKMDNRGYSNMVETLIYEEAKRRNIQ